MAKRARQPSSKPKRTVAAAPCDTNTRSPGVTSKEPTHQLGFVLMPHFNAMATLAAIDPFRAANCLCARQIYGWTLLSLDGNPVQDS